MALFNRRKDQTISDLEDYYANRNNRTGMAWLMAFLSLLVTISVIAGLFFGGRWVYRTLTDDNTTVITTTTSTGTPATTGESTTNEANNSSEGAVTAPSTPNISGSVEPNGVVSDEAVSTSTPNTSRTNTSSTTPTTGDSSQLPNTGAGSIFMITPIIVATAGYVYAIRRELKG